MDKNNPNTKLKEYSDTLAIQSGIKMVQNSKSFKNRQTSAIHERPLSEQQSSIFWAFFYNDRNYIYEFDAETEKKRAVFGKRALDIGFQFILYYSISNLLYHNFLGKPKKIRFSLRGTCFAAINIVPLFYFYYKGSVLYRDVNDFLFDKYLKWND